MSGMDNGDRNPRGETAGKAERCPGTVVAGRYRICRLIGRGGMSFVYLAEDMESGERRALKEVRRDIARNYDVVRKGLLVENAMLSRLSHPRLPKIYDVIREDDACFIVMDYIEGRSLGAVLREEGPQMQELVIFWAMQLCDVLGYLHAQEPPVIYRDMKPSNVMLRPDGEVVLLDFGIARRFKRTGNADTTCLGTVGYAAPEQFGGNGQSDARTDIYSLGATMCHLLTGRKPDGSSVDASSVCRVRPDISPGLGMIVARCMRREPAERYQTCAELADALRNCSRLDTRAANERRRRIALFLLPAAAAFFGLMMSLGAHLSLVSERRSDYMTAMTAASGLAAQSAQSGRFDRNAFDSLTAAIDLDPSRSEAYLKLLEYCRQTGSVRAGLSAVCSRIDAGVGGIDRCDAVLLETAELYFGGDGSAFAPDFAKAARYYAMVNEKKVPEAKAFATLAGALSGNAGMNPAAVADALAEVERIEDGQLLNEQKIRNYMLCADVWVANRRAFAAENMDAYAHSTALLEKARAEAEQLMEDEAAAGGYAASAEMGAGTGDADVRVAEEPAASAEMGAGTGDADVRVAEEYAASADEMVQSTGESDVSGTYREIIRNLAAQYYAALTLDSAAADPEKSLAYYKQLRDMTKQAEELRDIDFRMAEVTEATGDDGRIREMYAALAKRYPDEAEPHLAFCEYLLETGAANEAAGEFAAAKTKRGAELAPNYEALRERLEG
jgi:serine/threonine protein kinase